MKNMLSWQAICDIYPNQWVSLSNLHYDDSDNIVSAIVVAAHPELSEVAAKSKGLDFDSHTFRYTGDGLIPKLDC